jgi:penicillin-binding protein 1A
MALPVWAYFMQRVFADKSLGYKPDEKFELPSGYDPCKSEEDRYGLNGIEEVYE